MSMLSLRVLPGGEIRAEHRSVVVCGVLALVALVLGFGGLCYGDGWSTPGDVVAALDGDGTIDFQVTHWRLPRATAALLFGAALGLSGAIFQNLTRNPLGTPDVIGLDQGAFTGVLLMITFGQTASTVTGVGLGGGAGLALAALAGGILAAALIYLLAAGPGYSGLRLIVMGIAINAILGAANSFIILRADLDVAIAATAWSAGSINGTGWSDLAVPALVIIALGLLLAGMARPMHQLALGDDVAVASGVGLVTLRLGLAGVGVALTAVVTAAAGPIIFVALAAPQIGRRLAGSAGVTLAPAALTGAVLLAAADLTAQAAFAPVMLPVGVVTSAFGGIYLLWLLLREVR